VKGREGWRGEFLTEGNKVNEGEWRGEGRRKAGRLKG
jgi:hypothetical protein